MEFHCAFGPFLLKLSVSITCIPQLHWRRCSSVRTTLSVHEQFPGTRKVVSVFGRSLDIVSLMCQQVFASKVASIIEGTKWRSKSQLPLWARRLNVVQVTMSLTKWYVSKINKNIQIYWINRFWVYLARKFGALVVTFSLASHCRLYQPTSCTMMSLLPVPMDTNGMMGERGR